MAEPQQPLVMPYRPSNGESLQVLTTNNRYWEQDRLKVWYLQAYVKQLLLKDAVNNKNNKDNSDNNNNLEKKE